MIILRLKQYIVYLCIELEKKKEKICEYGHAGFLEIICNDPKRRYIEQAHLMET